MKTCNKAKTKKREREREKERESKMEEERVTRRGLERGLKKEKTKKREWRRVRPERASRAPPSKRSGCKRQHVQHAEEWTCRMRMPAKRLHHIYGCQASGVLPGSINNRGKENEGVVVPGIWEYGLCTVMERGLPFPPPEREKSHVGNPPPPPSPAEEIRRELAI